MRGFGERLIPLFAFAHFLAVNRAELAWNLLGVAAKKRS
jgi:hypothetical protein